MEKFILVVFLLIVLICPFFFSACDGSNEEAIPVTYFEFEVDDSYATDYTDDWIILHSNNGDVLDFTPFERGQQLVFDNKIIIETMSVTLLRKFQDSPQFSLESYLGILGKQKWTLKGNSPYPQMENRGDITVTINDPDAGELWDSHISCALHESLPDLNKTPIEFPPFGIHSPYSNIFIFTTDKSRRPKYKFLEDPEAGSMEYTLDDFNDFDKTIHINFPPSNSHFLIVRAYENTDTDFSRGYMTNFRLHGIIQGFPANSYEVGYLDRFTTYLTEFHSFGQGNIHYEAFGPAPQNDLNLNPQFNIGITDPGFQSFSTSSSDFHWRMSNWFISQNNFSIGWVVRSDNAHLKNLQQLPELIRSKYPELDISRLVHNGTTFYKGTRTYHQFVDSRFRGVPVAPYQLIYNTAQ